MPFRKNYFGDNIAQPGTDRAEIDTSLCDSGCLFAKIVSAEIFPYEGEDEDFKCGGVLYIEGEDDEGSYVCTQMSFDGFETNAKVRDWLLSIDILPSEIEEPA